MSDELTADTPPGPDGTPFDQDRWNAYIQHSKAEREELRTKLAEAESVWSDQTTALAKLQETYPELFEDETPEPEEEPERYEAPEPKPDPRIDWLAQKEAERQFESDLKRFAGDRDLDGKGKEWVEARSRHLADKAGKQWGPEQLEQAVNDYFDFVEEIRGPQRRDAPAPPQAGKAGEAKYDPRDRTARRARMAAAIEAANQQ